MSIKNIIQEETREQAIERYHAEAMRQLRWLLIDTARTVAKHGISYRGFHVGCAVLGVVSDTAHSFGIRHEVFKGSNLKPVQDCPKVCAEQIAVGAARVNGATRILTVVVAGEPQPDEKSAVESKTLHPCWVCRTLFQHIPEIRPDTVIITVNNGDDDSIEEHTFAELLALHERQR